MLSWYIGASPLNYSVTWLWWWYHYPHGHYELPQFSMWHLSVICLGNPKLTVGSITEIVEAKTTLT